VGNEKDSIASHDSQKEQDPDSGFVAAVLKGDFNRAASLLEAGASVNAKKNNGKTALIIAAERGKYDDGFTAFLLEHGADLSMKENKGNTAFLSAAKSGNREGLQQLLESGADINDRNFKGQTALILAASGEHSDIVRLLLDRGIAVDDREIFGWNALMYSALRDNPLIVRMLARSGADIDARFKLGHTPLMEAAAHGMGDALKVLLEHGADMTLKNDEGKTALQIAKERKRDYNVEILSDWGKKIALNGPVTRMKKDTGALARAVSLVHAKERASSSQPCIDAETEARVTALLRDFLGLRDDGGPLKAPWQLGQLPREVRLELQVRLEGSLRQDPRHTWASIKSRFFDDLDPYMVWHDGLESVVDFNLLNGLYPKERIVAELVFYNALEKEFDDRWLTGLVRLKSKDGLGLFRQVFAREQYSASLIKTAGAILAFEPESEQLNFIAETISGPQEESVKIDAMTEIKILINNGVYKESHPPFLDESLFMALKAPEYHVRYHAYDTLKMLHNIRIDLLADPVFELLLENRTIKDFRKAEKMMREKMNR
jgi:ankyrin repeat protein